MKKIIFILLLLSSSAFAQTTPPGSNGQFIYNNSGIFGAGTFGTGLSFSGGTLTNSGVASYPSSGIPQSTGSAWGTSITPGTGVVTALGNATNGTGGLLTFSGAFGTPTSLTLTNASGLPTTGLTGTLQVAQFPALTGDITTTAGSFATTLATVNSNVGSFGSTTNCVAFTTNGKGLITAASQATCAPAVASITGLGANVATALGVAVGSAGAFVVNGGVLGTPSSGTLTNTTGFPAANLSGTALPAAIVSSSLTSVGTLATGVWNATAVGSQWGGTGQNLSGSTGIPSLSSGTWSVSTTPTFTGTNISGTATSLISGSANALASASTTVNVSSATAPTVGQSLTATSSTTATWQTPYNAVGPSLANLYRLWNTLNTQIVRIENLGDSIITCNQLAPCTFGPARLGSTFPLQLINELAQRYPQYSTGYRPIVRLANATTTVSAGDGYTLTSGSITNSTLLGPQQSGVSLNGGSLITLSNAGVITINVGQPYSSINIACVQGSGVSGYTVTINGSSVGTACGLGSGANTAVLQNFVNPVAFASQPVTGSTLTITALGATNYYYAYEGVLFCTAANTACTSGFVVDNFGVGGASSPWFASGTKAGATDGGMVWVKAVAGKVALCILENGENDAQASSGPVTSTQQNAQNQIVATDCQNLGSSILFWVPPPYNNGGSPAVYAGLQQGSLTYCQAQGWACLNMADIFMNGISGTTSSAFPFSAQNTGMGLTPPWGVAQGLITNSDNQHLDDCGELLATQQFLATVFPHIIFNYTTTGACSQNPQASAISTAYTNATTGFTIVQGATANTGQLEFVSPINQSFHTLCSGYMTVGTTGVVSFEVVGSASISTINSTLFYQTASASALSTTATATALSSAMATSSITAASNLKWNLEINGVNSTTSNSFAIEAHEASGTLTIPAGATCTTQLSGPQ